MMKGRDRRRVIMRGRVVHAGTSCCFSYSYVQVCCFINKQVNRILRFYDLLFSVLKMMATKVREIKNTGSLNKDERKHLVPFVEFSAVKDLV